MTQTISGVLSPVVTPYAADGSPDLVRYLRHCQWLVSQNVGLAIFGTNSEGNSLTVAERLKMMDALVEGGIDPKRLMPGTGCCAGADSVTLSAHATRLGAAGVMMLPPFYYKGVSDEGLYRAYASIIEGVGSDALRIYLYHIPQVAQVGISLGLIERLLGAFPGIIAGIKDSSGDWNNTQAMLERFQPQGFDVFAGSEGFLLQTLRGGGVGCISATANVNPAAIHDLYANWQAGDADARQQKLNVVRAAFARFPMIPALKQAIAHWGGDAGWPRVRPPLVELDAAQAKALIEGLTAIGFDMPGIKG